MRWQVGAAVLSWRAVGLANWVAAGRARFAGPSGARTRAQPQRARACAARAAGQRSGLRPLLWGAAEAAACRRAREKGTIYWLLGRATMMSPRALATARGKIEERLEQVAQMQVSDVQVTTSGMIYEMFNDANSSIAAMWCALPLPLAARAAPCRLPRDPARRVRCTSGRRSRRCSR
jgi:hypothetical protein|eukprot:COSAG06_NODE_1598_length_8970_cov_9.246280_3_plen_177_part_00